MNEAETRAELIDPALRAAGWGVVEGSRIRREFPITLGRLEGAGRRGKALTADYILEYRCIRLAVVEAKARDLPVTEGLAQAKNYAGKLAIRHAYSTNGRGLYVVDMHTAIEGEASTSSASDPLRFPTPAELLAATYPSTGSGQAVRELVERFAAILAPSKSGTWQLRSYQEGAVRRVLEAMAEGRRRILLTLATGTGKTSIAFQIAWALFESRWNLARDGQRRPRILFLADRNTLATQAFNDFNGFTAFEERGLVRIKPDEIRKKGGVPTNGAVFFTIFQTFMASTGSATEGSAASTVDFPEVTEIRPAYGYMYILSCAEGGFYVGSTRDLRLRMEQHKSGTGARYTAANLPIKLIYHEPFDRIDDAFQREKQVQGWSRAKKIALIQGDKERLRQLAKSGSVPEPVEGYYGDYPADFFDFIIIDECHRGGANDESTWRDILTYFAPAVQLGLTATPKRRDNVDTYAYFGEPVFIYSLKDGINDGFLTPFRVRQISTTLDDYVYTPDDRVEEGEVEIGRRYEEKDFNRVIQIDARERKRVDLFMGMIDQREKTLVFCASQDHALAVRDYINQTARNRAPNYCARVTAADGALGEEHLREFQDNEKTLPTILTTSQKLSTGVDARNIRNIVLLRSVNSMIEFKQIIGRGTRLFDGKDYFTLYDFVKAHHHFADPEWDGEPISPEPAGGSGGTTPPPPPPRTPPQPPLGGEPAARPAKIKITLADGKARTIQHMAVTSFWHPDGTPMSAQQFMELLFGQLPDFFHDEAELRTLWSEPTTRTALLQGLAEKGFGPDQLREMQRIIDAESSDLFDVLAHVAYALPPLSREERATKARVEISTRFNSKQQVFLDFVLSHYVGSGVHELAPEKLHPLLRLKYRDSIADAVAELGTPVEIGRTFASFQKYLYVEAS